MDIDDLSVCHNMETDVMQGLDNSVSRKRFGAIQRAANGAVGLETSKVEKGIPETVKNLEKETQEMFPDKDENGTVEIPLKDKILANKTIMGMKPLTFGLVAVGTILATYIIIKSFNNK